MQNKCKLIFMNNWYSKVTIRSLQSFLYKSIYLSNTEKLNNELFQWCETFERKIAKKKMRFWTFQTQFLFELKVLYKYCIQSEKGKEKKSRRQVNLVRIRVSCVHCTLYIIIGSIELLHSVGRKKILPIHWAALILTACYMLNRPRFTVFERVRYYNWQITGKKRTRTILIFHPMDSPFSISNYTKGFHKSKFYSFF